MRYLLTFAAILCSVVSSQAQFQTNNSATNLGGGTYQLTTATNNIYGSIWYKLQHDLTTPLNVQGQMYFGNDDNGADGIAFVLQNNCLAAGTAGGGIGYEAMPGQSIAVEFDTYQNILGTGSFDNSDPVEDHIAVMTGGVVNHASSNNLFGPVQASSTSTNIEDGIWHDFQINYNPTTHLLQVYFDNVLRVSYTYDIVANVFGGSPYVYWGFTSSTGGFFNDQQVKIDANLTTITLPNQTICTGSVTVDLPPLTRYNGLNQALNKTATISSSEWGNMANGQEAIDGNMGTRWSSNWTDNEWIYVDLGTSYDLDSVVLMWEGAFGSGYQIQTSNDNITWTTQATIVGGDGGKDKIVFSANGRYVKMQGITRATGYGYSLWEFRIYGAANYLWSPDNGTIDNIYSANATFTPTTTTTYTVTIPDPCRGAVTYDMTITVDCPMPLDLITFTGNHGSGVNHLNWSTSWESNTSYFTVLRSTDGVNFTPLGRVTAAGNSQSVKRYTLDDPQPQNLNYYKLITTDKDGATSTSNIVTLSGDESSIYITDPVFSNNTSLVLPGYSGPVTITVVDALGRVILEEHAESTEGLLTFGDALPSSTSFYMAIVQTATERKVFKLIKH